VSSKRRDPKVGTGKKPKGSGRRLYTDENPRDTVGIKFATPTDARRTVAKVKKIKKPFARKIQILTVGEQRAKVMGKSKVAAIFKKGKDRKVLIKIKQKNKWYKTELNKELDKLNLDKHEILIFCDPYFSYTLDNFQDIIDSYNFWYNRKDIYFMGFHPRGTPTLEEHAFLVDPGPEESYDGELEYLPHPGYYNGWPKEYYNEVVKSRYKTYNKIRRSL
jgi:hypothetical protein